MPRRLYGEMSVPGVKREVRLGERPKICGYENALKPALGVDEALCGVYEPPEEVLTLKRSIV